MFKISLNCTKHQFEKIFGRNTAYCIISSRFFPTWHLLWQLQLLKFPMLIYWREINQARVYCSRVAYWCDSKCQKGRNLIDFTSQIPKNDSLQKSVTLLQKCSSWNFTFGVRLFKSGEELRWHLLGKRKIALGCADATSQYFVQTAKNFTFWT